MKEDTEDYSPTFEEFVEGCERLMSDGLLEPPLWSYPGMAEALIRVQDRLIRLEETLMRKPMGPPVVKTTVPPGTAMVPKKKKNKRKPPKGTSPKMPLMPSMKP